MLSADTGSCNNQHLCELNSKQGCVSSCKGVLIELPRLQYSGSSCSLPICLDRQNLKLSMIFLFSCQTSLFLPQRHCMKIHSQWSQVMKYMCHQIVFKFTFILILIVNQLKLNQSIRIHKKGLSLIFRNQCHYYTKRDFLFHSYPHNFIPYTQKVFISINFRHFCYLRQLILKTANFTKYLYMLQWCETLSS